MRVNSIQNVRMSSLHSPKKNLRKETNHETQLAFNGLKGAGVGAGAGALYGAAVLGMLAVGAPYLLPIMATEVIAGSIGAGALVGHRVQEESKGDQK